MNKLIFKILRYSGLPWLFRQLFQNNKTTILLFHEINMETAEKSFSYLMKKYNVISLNKYLEAYDKNDKNGIPKKALIITFDDGLLMNYDMLSVIKNYNVPVTIFLCSEIINTKRHFWYKYKPLPMATEDLKKLPNHKRLETLATVGFSQDKEYSTTQALTKRQIIEMSEVVNMQSHTKFHPCLPNCEFEEAKAEIFESKEMLESEYGFNINALAYPNGDYSDRDVELSRAAGYKCALTVDGGFNTLGSDLFRLKRFSVNDTKDLNELIVKSSGLWGAIKSIFSKIKN